MACNVLVVPEKANITIPERTVFATDYNLFYTHPILEAISKIMHITKGQLYVLNLIAGNAALSKPQLKNKEYLQHYLEETLPKTHGFFSSPAAGVHDGILNFVEDHNIEMVIMVAKNLNFLQQLLFDTTVERLSFHTTVPLFVLHE